MKAVRFVLAMARGACAVARAGDPSGFVWNSIVHGPTIGLNFPF